jgi:hypothetical protein
MKCKVTTPPHEKRVRRGEASLARRQIQPARFIS